MQNQTSKLRIGVIGAGSMGRHHVRVLSELEGITFTGFFDPDTERANELCSRHRCAAYPSPEDLLKKSEAICIAAPTSLHFEIGMKCLKRGIHVLMEKPLAESVDKARKLVAEAEKRNLVLSVGHIERFNPATIKFFEIYNAGDEPAVSIEARRLSPFDGSRCMDVDVLHDLMIHDIDIVLEAANSEPKRIFAVGHPIFSDRTDVAHAIIDFEKGCSASLWTAKCSPKKLRRTRIITRNSLFELDTLNKTLSVHRAATIPIGSGDACMMTDISVEQIDCAGEEPLRNEIIDFIEAVCAIRTPVVDGHRALRSLKILAGVEKSIRKRKEISI
jgi:virulence factor